MGPCCANFHNVGPSPATYFIYHTAERLRCEERKLIWSHCQCHRIRTWLVTRKTQPVMHCAGNWIFIRCAAQTDVRGMRTVNVRQLRNFTRQSQARPREMRFSWLTFTAWNWNGKDNRWADRTCWQTLCCFKSNANHSLTVQILVPEVARDLLSSNSQVFGFEGKSRRCGNDFAGDIWLWHANIK